jgi:SAM-dependent methyltransferase
VTKACPVCASEKLLLTVRRDRLPVLQNRVYDSVDEAIASPSAPFQLATCYDCGFSYNAAFDPAAIVYDEFYDNDVPSATFQQYYREVAQLLIDKLRLIEGTVYDVGCGKGAFLAMLCDEATGIRGVGIDPSCTPESRANFTLVRDMFRPEHFDDTGRLVVLRHVLEHLPDPVGFLTELRNAAPATPLYVEVPTVDWIFKNAVFWDLCYEHCNYFNPATLRHTLRRAGYEVEDAADSFGGQYQWALCKPSQPSSALPAERGGAAAATASAYLKIETTRIAAVTSLLANAAAPILWGMATKGVILSNIAAGSGIVGGVDVNSKKQGKYVPVSGLQVHAPEWLAQLDTRPTVLVMNSNYKAEISRQIADLGIEDDVVSL